MTTDPAKYPATDAFQRLAVLVNQLPEEERSNIRAALGEFTHDLKHTIGLVTGANVLVSRTVTDQTQVAEMVEIIQNASNQIDDLITLMVDQLNDQIRA
jgi:geranylgeranyl pyrophosphate synthase